MTIPEFNQISGYVSNRYGKWTIETYGCGCCSFDKALTTESLQELIEETQETLTKLFKLRDLIKEGKVQIGDSI